MSEIEDLKGKFEEETKKIDGNIEKLFQAVSIVQDNVSSIMSSLDNAGASDPPSDPPSQTNPRFGATGDPRTPRHADSGEDDSSNLTGLLGAGPGPQQATASVAVDYQAEYGVIKDSVVGIQLPKNWKLKESRRGVKKDDIPVFEVIKDCARYTETALKILGYGPASTQGLAACDVQAVITTLLAELQFLEDKYSALVVRSKHSKEVASMFELYNAGTSGLSQRHRQNLVMAVQSAPRQDQPQPRETHQQGQRPQRGRPNFQHRPWQDRNYHGNQRQDTYSGMVRGIPNTRPNNQNHSTSDNQ